MKTRMRIKMCTGVLIGVLVGATGTAARADKIGGNGQLVVVPKGHSRPVPYEVAVTWETGKYRNFERLPCMPGVVEPRPEFNRPYACHALKWLELVKAVSPKLHEELLQVARRTHFNLVDNEIFWQATEPKDGELDYKTYQKAAFYNDEIILSVPAMERIGPLGTDTVVLTREENQGLIVFQQLIHALYPYAEGSDKMDFAEVFVQKRMFQQSKEEALLHLALTKLEQALGSRHLLAEKDLDLLARVLSEFREVRSDWGGTIGRWLYVIEHQLKPGLSFREGYLAHLERRKVKGNQEFTSAHDEYVKAVSPWIPEEEMRKALDVDFLVMLTEKYGLDLNELNFYTPGTGLTRAVLSEARTRVVHSSVTATTFANYEARLAAHPEQTFITLASNIIVSNFEPEAASRYFRFKEADHSLKAELRDALMLNPLWANYRYRVWSSRDAEDFYDEFKPMALQALKRVFEKRGYDYERTREYLRWRWFSNNHNDGSDIITRPPLEEGDQVLKSKESYTWTTRNWSPLQGLCTIRSIQRSGGRYVLRLREQDGNHEKITQIGWIWDVIILKQGDTK